MSEQLHERLDSFERRLTGLRQELDELRRLAGPAPAAPQAPTPKPARSQPIDRPPLPKVELPPPPARSPARPPLSTRIGDALGARALALTGGAVTLLGVVLLFALAVNRGWIGPWERCGIGAAASCAVFAGGIWLRRRYGQTYSALAAVGAGIAGAYATLLAAAALYHLLPDLGALAVAAGIAAVGVVTAVAWSAQIVAGLGLIGATLVPVAVVFDSGLSVLGTSFVAIMLVATGIVSLARRWWRLLAVGVAASGAQIAALVWQAEPGSTSVTALAAIFWLVYLGLAIARQLLAGRSLQPLSASLALFAAVFAGASALHLFDGQREGFALLVVAGTYGLAGSAFLARRGQRDLSSLLCAVAVAVGAVAVADLLSGSVLAVAWSAEAAVLGWLGARIREPRFEAGAVAYVVLATVHVLAFDAPVGHLFVATEHPGIGAIPVAAAALAAALVAHYSAWARDALLWTAGSLGTYALSLAILEAGFEWGAVPVSALWALEAAVLLAAGSRSRQLRIGGGIVLGLALAKVYAYDLAALSRPIGFYSSLAVGLLVLAGGYLHGRAREGRGAGRLAALSVVASADLLGIAVTGLLDGIPQGTVLLGVGAGYALLAATVLRERRNLSTWLWAPGLVFVLAGWDDLLGGTPVVVAWAATAVVAVYLAARTGESRLRLAAETAIGLTLLRALVTVAPPSDLFVAGPHPGRGVLALAVVAVAVAALALSDGRTRRLAPWVAGLVGVVPVSLAILQVFEWLGTGSVHLEFQHGHTAVSAFWGLLGLVALYGGLTRRSRRLQRAGFAIFALSLGKIFLYDLSQLSSITRALSFLAVGAVLLLGGFFYQRLSSQLEERHAAVS